MTLFQEGNTVSNNKLIFPVALKTIITKYSKYNFKQYGSRTFKRGLTRTSKMTSYQCILQTSIVYQLPPSLHRGLYTVSNSEFGNFVITLRSILSKFMHIPFIQAH